MLKRIDLNGVPHNLQCTVHSRGEKWAHILDLINLDTRKKENLARSNKIYDTAQDAIDGLNEKLKKKGYDQFFVVMS